MIENKMFIRDFITPTKLKKYLIYIAIFAFLMELLFKDKVLIYFSDSASSVIGIGIAFSSTAYVIYTYSVLENIRLYLTLPIRKGKVFGAFFLALWLCSIIQRISFVIILIAYFNDHIIENIVLLLVNSGVAVLINIGILLGKNAKKTGSIILNFILVCILLLIGYCDLLFLYKLFFALLIGICAILSFGKKDITDLIIYHEPKTSKRRLTTNYFLRVVTTEKIYLINTFCIVVFLIVLFLISKSNPIMMNLTWCVGAVNTPFLTMISSDPWVSRHIDMLPERKNNIFMQYRIFLTVYFIFINVLIVAAKYFLIGGAWWKDIIFAVLLIIFETHFSTMLENKHRIVGWQTKQELWKNPRKYILPLGVFTCATIFYLIV